MSEPVTCSDCDRERTEQDKDYDPMGLVFGTNCGWYSGKDGELCPECMEIAYKKANGL